MEMQQYLRKLTLKDSKVFFWRNCKVLQTVKHNFTEVQRLQGMGMYIY